MCIAAAFGSASPALALTATGPIRVAACVVYNRDTPNTVLDPGIALTNGVSVTLVNDSHKTTTKITVTGDYHGRHVTDSADVKLKPGSSITITRSYYPPSTYEGADAVCRVTSVSFDDGTSWSAP